jgi:hypothetical protein
MEIPRGLPDSINPQDGAFTTWIVSAAENKVCSSELEIEPDPQGFDVRFFQRPIHVELGVLDIGVLPAVNSTPFIASEVRFKIFEEFSLLCVLPPEHGGRAE